MCASLLSFHMLKNIYNQAQAFRVYHGLKNEYLGIIRVALRTRQFSEILVIATRLARSLPLE